MNEVFFAGMFVGTLVLGALQYGWYRLEKYFDAKLPFRSYDHFCLTKAEKILLEHPPLYEEYTRRCQ